MAGSSAVALLASVVALSAEAAAQERGLTPDVRVHNAFPSKHVERPLDILVCLPHGYSKDFPKRYPVLYMHDGSNVYVAWRLDETVNALAAANRIEPVLLVLIPNGGTPEDRYNDYTWTKPANAKSGGKAGAYGRMIVEELKPFIDATYRTLTEPEHTGVGGASLGGIVSMYFGLKYPATFGKLAVVSPAVWWDTKILLEEVKRDHVKPASRIWLDVGRSEPRDMIAGARELRDALVRKGWQPDENLSYAEIEGGRHGDEWFAQRAERILTFLFPPR